MGMKHGHEWSDMYTQSTRAAGLRVYISDRQRETPGIMKLATCVFPLKLQGISETKHSKFKRVTPRYFNFVNFIFANIEFVFYKVCI